MGEERGVLCVHSFLWMGTDASVRLRLQTRQLPTTPARAARAAWAAWTRMAGDPRLAATTLAMVVVFMILQKKEATRCGSCIVCCEEGQGQAQVQSAKRTRVGSAVQPYCTVLAVSDCSLQSAVYSALQAAHLRLCLACMNHAARPWLPLSEVSSKQRVESRKAHRNGPLVHCTAPAARCRVHTARNLLRECSCPTRHTPVLCDLG